MTAQVKFINTMYWPNEEERERLQDIQDKINFFHQTVRHEEKCEYQKMVRKQRLYSSLREAIRVVT